MVNVYRDLLLPSWILSDFRNLVQTCPSGAASLSLCIIPPFVSPVCCAQWHMIIPSKCKGEASSNRTFKVHGWGSLWLGLAEVKTEELRRGLENYFHGLKYKSRLWFGFCFVLFLDKVLCDPDWPWTILTGLHFLSARMIGRHYHAWLSIQFFLFHSYIVRISNVV